MLHELVEYARREGLSSEPGFGPKWVRWLIVFLPDGTFHEVSDLKGNDKKSKGREFPVCPVLSQPEMISYKLRHFLIDSVDKVCLLTKEEPTDKDERDHSAFLNLMQKASEDIRELAPVATALQAPEIKDIIRENLREQKAKPTDTATIAILHGLEHRILVKEALWHDWWRSFRDSLGGDVGKAKPSKRKSVVMRCFISGELVEPVATQDKVKGLSDVGGLPTGDVLSSFDKEAFNHYEFEQGQNAAIGEQQIKAITDTLNQLIQERGKKLASSKVIYWYSHSLKKEDADPMEGVFGGAFSFAGADDDEEEATDQQVFSAEASARELLDAIRTGKRPELAQCEFYALTLSGNSGRVVMRDWMQGRFEDLLDSVIAWFDDLSIISRDGSKIVRGHKFAAVLGAFVRDLKDTPSASVSALWRCALNKKLPIPVSLMAQTLARVRMDIVKDEPPRHARLGLLRAFCIRSSEVPSMTAEVDESIDDVAYLCGRIMAVLAEIQLAAMPEVGAGVVQRYYAAASATPALVLGRLVRTAQIAHLPKIEKVSHRHTFEGRLSNLWARMKQAPPSTLTLEQQTLFAMGFYQQKAERYKKKDDATVTDSAS